MCFGIWASPARAGVKSTPQIISGGRLEVSRAARLSGEGSEYLERSGYLEGGVGTTRYSGLEMARSAQDDSVRYEEFPATEESSLPAGGPKLQLLSGSGLWAECPSCLPLVFWDTQPGLPLVFWAAPARAGVTNMLKSRAAYGMVCLGLPGGYRAHRKLKLTECC